jgi:hypothetical protein
VDRTPPRALICWLSRRRRRRRVLNIDIIPVFKCLHAHELAGLAPVDLPVCGRPGHPVWPPPGPHLGRDCQLARPGHANLSMFKCRG